jgi:hypothetical protein
MPPQQNQAPHTSSPRQPFILRSNPGFTPVPESYEAATRQVNAPIADTRGVHQSQPGFATQAITNQQAYRPTQEAIQHPYPQNVQQYQTPIPQAAIPQQGYANPHFQSGSYPTQDQEDGYARGRVTGLVLILLGLLLVIGAIVLFAFNNHLLGLSAYSWHPQAMIQAPLTLLHKIN